MERTHFVLRSRLDGGHIVCTVFSGEEGRTLEEVGELRWSVNKIGEWQLFGAMLVLGSQLTGKARVTFERDDSFRHGVTPAGVGRHRLV